MAEEVVLKVIYTEQDFVDAAEGYRAPRRIPTLLAWLTISLTAFGIWRFALIPFELFVAIFLGLAFYLFVFQPLIINLLTRREFQDRSDPNEEVDLSFSEAGVIATSTRIAGKNYWSVFTGGAQTDEGILLFYGQSSYLILPRRFFAGTDKEPALMRLLLSKVPNFKTYKRVGPTLARAKNPIVALLIAIVVLVVASWLASFLATTINRQ